MKKLLLILLIALFVLGCGEKSSSEDGVIKLKGYMLLDLGAPESKVNLGVIEQFNEMYPNIQIEWEFANHESYMQKLPPMSSANTLPDIFSAYAGQRTGFLYERDQVIDISPYLTEEKKSEYNPFIWEGQSDDDRIFIIPPDITVTHVIYANNRIMDELGITFPKTHEEMIAQAEIANANGYTLLSSAGAEDWMLQSTFLGALVGRIAGVDFLREAQKGNKKFTDPDFVRALSIIKELYDKGVFNPGLLQYTQLAGSEEFLQGKSVYFMDGSWRTLGLKSVLSEEELENISIHLYPSIDGAKSPMITTGVNGTGLAINAKLLDDKEKADAAFKFVEFFSGREGSSYKIERGIIPAYQDLDFSQFNIDPLTTKHMEFYASSEIQPLVIDGIMDAEGVMSIINPGIQAILLNNKTPQEVAEEYEKWVSENEPTRLGK